MTIQVAGIVPDSIVDGIGNRLTVFTQGCPHRCPGCHNPQTHAFGIGTEMTPEEILAQIADNPLLSGVTFSGGEPFSQAQALAELGQRVQEMGGLDIVTFTGYTFEQLLDGMEENPGWRALLEVTDVLIDGPFLMEQKSYELRFRGSSNQRCINVPESLRSGTVVLAEAYA